LSRNLEISWSTTPGIKEHKLGSGIEEYKSALFKHTRSTGHKIDYNSPVILDKASNDNKLLLKEMLHINRLKPTLNKQKKSALFNDNWYLRLFISLLSLFVVLIFSKNFCNKLIDAQAFIGLIFSVIFDLMYF